MAEAQTFETSSQIVEQLGRDAKAASAVLGQCSTDTINTVLKTLSELLIENQDTILEANKKDLAAGEQKGLSPALLDRLKLTPERIAGIASGVDVVRELEDPVGKTLWDADRPNGLKIQRVAVPIGVLGMI